MLSVFYRIHSYITQLYCCLVMSEKHSDSCFMITLCQSINGGAAGGCVGGK